MNVMDPARRHLVRDRHVGEVHPSPPFSVEALSSADDRCSGASAGSRSAAAERSESFVGTTEFGEYDSDREDGEIMHRYVTRRRRQLKGIIAKGLDAGVPKERFADMLLDGSGLSWEERQKVLAGVSCKLQG